VARSPHGDEVTSHVWAWRAIGYSHSGDCRASGEPSGSGHADIGDPTEPGN
jgi:hypothetical protein